MAQVLEQMYPGVKLTLGPAILMGSTMISILKIKKITEADFKKIEIAFLRFQRKT
jgi:threonyl-tRNA synthetase